MAPSTSPAPSSSDAVELARLAGFYRWHARIYDWTRPLLLFGRPAAADALQARAGQIVLDVGCGTGVNLPRLAKAGASVVGIECTEAMRDRARARIERAGLAGRVTLDGRPYGAHADYRGKVDRILFSYSLSMIPSFGAALEHAREDLRTGGRIAVVDFLDARGPVAYGLERSHVQLGPSRRFLLERLFPEHRLEVVSVGLWRYFLFTAEAG